MSRSVARGEVDLRIKNKARVVALNVRNMELHTSLGFNMELNNCYCIPTLSQNIISTSCLLRNIYVFSIKGNGYSVYMKEMFYGYAPIVHGLFIFNLDDKHVYNIYTKRLA